MCISPYCQCPGNMHPLPSIWVCALYPLSYQLSINIIIFVQQHILTSRNLCFQLTVITYCMPTLVLFIDQSKFSDFSSAFCCLSASLASACFPSISFSLLSLCLHSLVLQPPFFLLPLYPFFFSLFFCSIFSAIQISYFLPLPSCNTDQNTWTFWSLPPVLHAVHQGS